MKTWKWALALGLMLLMVPVFCKDAALSRARIGQTVATTRAEFTLLGWQLGREEGRLTFLTKGQSLDRGGTLYLDRDGSPVWQWYLPGEDKVKEVSCTIALPAGAAEGTLTLRVFLPRLGGGKREFQYPLSG